MRVSCEDAADCEKSNRRHSFQLQEFLETSNLLA